jgi:hypothetical protein
MSYLQPGCVWRCDPQFGCLASIETPCRSPGATDRLYTIAAKKAVALMGDNGDDEDNGDNEWQVERLGPGSAEQASRRARIARYRRHAAALRSKAESMKDRTVREQFLDVARQYDQLALSIEQLPMARRGRPE